MDLSPELATLARLWELSSSCEPSREELTIGSTSGAEPPVLPDLKRGRLPNVTEFRRVELPDTSPDPEGKEN
jgi:hypothetical protein